MDDRDAFGRSTSEDPLADMGWSSGGAEAPDAGPVEIAMPGTGAPSPSPAPGRPAPPGLPRRRRRPGLGCVFPLVVLVFIVSVFAVVVPAVIDGLDAVDEVDERQLPTDDDAGRPGRGGSGGNGNDNGRRRQRRPPSGRGDGSLLRRENLAPALARLRGASETTRLRSLRVAADRVILIGLNRRGEQVVALSDRDSEARVLARTPNGPTVATYAWSAVDPAAPGRIARQATRGRRAGAFNYAVLGEAGGLAWQAFLTDGTHFSASPDGRRVRRIS